MFVVVASYVAVTIGLFMTSNVNHLFELSFDHAGAPFWQMERLVWVTMATVGVLLTGAWYKTHQLRQGGGAVVAEQLGGIPLAAGNHDILHRRLLNVVEEMALASGLPVPPVYVLEQSGMNALAAGFTPSDMVIGVTRGAMELLDRDELQGVIAHEFSHILHGDTRLNMQMIGLLHGMTFLSDLGIVFLTGRRSWRDMGRRRNPHPGLAVLGILIFMAGLLGVVAADLIKRAVSRQREFLADASAVQFTRNPAGIANALKTIGGYDKGSRVAHEAASSFGFFFFAYAERSIAMLRKGGARDWWASHPPLQERIQRIEPSFRGQLPHLDAPAKKQHVWGEASVGVAYAMSETSVPLLRKNDLLHVMDGLDGRNFQQAGQRLAAMPARLKNFAHDPYTARALCYAMLMSASREVKKKQWTLLERQADPNVLHELLDIQKEVEALPSMLRLPLLEMTIPALKSLSAEQYSVFVKNIRMLMQADHQISLFEYALHRMLLKHLKPSFSSVKVPRVRYQHMREVTASAACILAILIQYGRHEDPKGLFGDITHEYLEESLPWPPERLLQIQSLDKALNQLAQAAPDVKKKLLAACVDVVFDDGVLHEHEWEALRAVADALDCPIPML